MCAYVIEINMCVHAHAFGCSAHTGWIILEHTVMGEILAREGAENTQNTTPRRQKVYKPYPEHSGFLNLTHPLTISFKDDLLWPESGAYNLWQTANLVRFFLAYSASIPNLITPN